MKKAIATPLEHLIKDFGINLKKEEFDYMLNRICEFCLKRDWFKPYHFNRTCEYLVTHWTEYRTINVAVFKTAFVKVNQKD